MTLPHPKGEFDSSRAQWRSAPGGSHGSRVEVAFVDDLIGLRNGADPDSPILVFTQAEWDAFVLGAKDGEFDVQGQG
ncbi:DUF397 domain-containing protein [Dactylosporangium sucinum]|uniref:DUF397 domain-containing protein n=1 Tax=Dactylosporangium sucinum TaxID=1424081 RepID=A0A917TMX0_9ACTN|nr:DUF397 domain-containing protein [Dactylosporangium sucinum]GGM28332.1 hypothetical protein GCM10007977_032100 [Dactylosporangium sucinum]